MLKKIVAASLLALGSIVAVIILYATINVGVGADGQLTFELACPNGSSSLPQFQTFNNTTNQWRANVCVIASNGYMLFQNNGNGPINAQLYCNLVGAPTDDGARLQACLTAYSGKHLILPKLKGPSTGGGGATNCDYKSTITLTMSGNSQWLDGSVGGSWSGGSCIQFSAATTGIIIPANCMGCRISTLELTSLDNGAVSAANGIEIRGGESVLEHVVVSLFGNHGIYVNGQSGLGYNANLWRMYDVNSNSNGGNGINIEGSDANAGVCDACSVIHNVIGIYNNSLLANTFIQPHADSNTSYSYKSTNTTAANTWVSPYSEGATPSQLNGVNVVVGGNLPYNWDGTNTNTPFTIKGGYLSGRAFGFWNHLDQEDYYYIICGLTADQNCHLSFPDYNGANKYDWRRVAATGAFELYQYSFNGNVIQVYPYSANPSLWLRGGGSGTVNMNYNSGTTVDFYGGTGAIKASVLTTGGLQQTGVAFASLGTPANGTIIYCTDCTFANPCAGAGTGAFAKRLNGAWRCD